MSKFLSDPRQGLGERCGVRVLREEAALETKVKVYPGGLHGFNVSFPGTSLAKKHEEDTIKGVAWLLSLVKEG